MESDGSDDGFARQGQPGEALDIGDDQFDSEDNLDEQEEPSQEAPQKPVASQATKPNPQVKGTTVDN